jgi:hypothetical protein
MRAEKQSGTSPETYMNMWSNFLADAGQNKAVASLVKLTKVHQQQCLNMSKAWVDHLWKMGEASRSGDVKKVMEASRDSNKDLLNACQESLKEQATARYELLRAFIPAIGKSTGTNA